MSYTIELSEANGKPGQSNGEWTNVLQPITLEDGDTLIIKQCLINTRSSSTATIIVGEDTTLSLTFGIYDNPHVVGCNTQGASRMLPESMTGGGNDPANYYANIWTPQAGRVDSQVLGDLTYEYKNTPWICMTRVNGAYQRLEITVNVVIPAGIYDPNDLADYITRELGEDASMFQSFNNQTPGLPNGMPEPNIDDGSHLFCYHEYFTTLRGQTQLALASNEWTYKLASSGDYSISLGAPNITMTFEDNRFRFEFLHTPVYLSDGTNFTILGAAQYSENNLFYARYGGIYIIDFQVTGGESDLLTRMGFTQTSYTDTDCTNLLDFSTTAYLNNGAKTNKLYSVPLKATNTNSIVSNYVVQSNLSTTIDAVTEYQYDVSGFYFINIFSSFNNNFITESGNYNKVSAICSKAYQNGDYVTGYSDSSLLYIHQGLPIVLTDYQVQILEPKTKQIAQALGNASTIILEVQKNPNIMLANSNKNGTHREHRKHH